MSKPVALAITTLTLPRFKVGVPFSVQIIAKGGMPPYRYVISPGLPWFSLTPSGLWSGIPTEANTWGFTITVIDKNGRADPQGYKVIVAPADPVPVVIPPAPAVITDPAYSDDPDHRRAHELGMGALFDQLLAVKNGGKQPLNVMTPNNLPPNCSMITDYAVWLHGSTSLSSPVDLSGWDNGGLQIYWNEPFPVKMKTGLIRTNPGWAYTPLHYDGPGSPDALFDADDVTFDQWSDVLSPYRQLTLWLPTNFVGKNLRFVRTAQTICNFGPGQKASLSNIYFESCGQNPYRRRDAAGNLLADDGSNDHPESFHHAGGQVTIDGFWADYMKKPFAGTGVAINQWRLDPKNWPYPGANNPDGLALYRNGFMLMGQGDMNYTIQLADGSSFPGKTRLENIAWRQIGTSKDHPGNNQVIDNQNSERLSGFKNLNFDTGELLPGRINMAA